MNCLLSFVLSKRNINLKTGELFLKSCEHYQQNNGELYKVKNYFKSVYKKHSYFKNFQRFISLVTLIRGT